MISKPLKNFLIIPIRLLITPLFILAWILYLIFVDSSEELGWKRWMLK